VCEREGERKRERERERETTLAKAMGKEIQWLMGWLQLVGSIKL